jgi:hemoglobin
LYVPFQETAINRFHRTAGQFMLAGQTTSYFCFPMTQHTHYDQIGGEETVRRLVDRFYELMETLPETDTIRHMHPTDLGTSREKLFMFLSGWLGGPQLYMEQYGHPHLRARHMPFQIGESERDQWMLCMRRALEEVGIPAEIRMQLENAFSRTADFMRNKT